MGNSHKVSVEDETPSEILKKKEQIEFDQNDFIRKVEGNVEDEYEILNPAMITNDFYEIRKVIYKRTKLCKSAFIINKYKVRTHQRGLLEDQIEKLKKIDNPYLQKIYELYYDKHRFYIISEFCYGQSLAQVLIEEGSIPERKAARIMYQLLHVLAECHRNNIIHSDLKLENITFNSKNEEVIKVTDFSISRIFRIEDIIEQSRRKAILAAPEALNGEPICKSDIWSCGILMYIILSGQIPIFGTTIRRLRQKLSYYEPNFQHESFKFISKEAKGLMRYMLQENTHQRPTAEECLRHPWFHRFYEPTRIDDYRMKSILIECFNFNPSSKLQEATWGFYVNAFISFEEKQSILHAFSTLDTGANNHLNEEDLRKGFLKFYDEKTSRLFANFIYKRHKCKPIKFSEFVSICTNRTFLINTENNKHLFKVFDDDDNGNIEVSELKAALGESKEITEEIWLELMKEADENSDGVISHEEFTNMMEELKNTNNEKLLRTIEIEASR